MSGVGNRVSYAVAVCRPSSVVVPILLILHILFNVVLRVLCVRMLRIRRCGLPLPYAVAAAVCCR